MDPATVILVLATHLTCSGGLFLVVGRQLPERCGIQLWGLCGLLFGAAFVGRLAAGLDAPPAWGQLSDIAMIGAMLLLTAGLRQFFGSEPLSPRAGLALLLGFAALQTLAVLGAGAVGRFAVINLGLGIAHLWVAAIAATARRGAEPGLQRPLLVLTILAGSQGLASATRGLHIAAAGVDVIYRGIPAQLYYAYSSLGTVLLAMILLWLLFARLNGQLSELATRDALTRLLNRTGLDDALRRHFGARGAQPLRLLALDIDHFKRINDTLGHASGDQVLRAVAGVLARGVRPNDIVARLGGEEFVVCCAAADAATALSLAERLRSAVAALSTVAADGRTTARCTISIGVSEACSALADWSRAAAAADRALYAAKAAGRDRVMAA
ncbi:GGDEF domain-containing protein [Piscinibacter koreensis]|uniref:diguanylate cyclase n=1 Tax=Piscinibacter koreensis TaxID=2742824 RepID=A0A7Y6NLR9_9BURK|nr:GGDEF domain-containing protein [Schlegelella koreensis]NUZ05520.1 GGDEF domain-containing protein [Schlegelella koreensis]